MGTYGASIQVQRFKYFALLNNFLTLDITARSNIKDVAAVTNALNFPYPITKRIVGLVILKM